MQEYFFSLKTSNEKKTTDKIAMAQVATTDQTNVPKPMMLAEEENEAPTVANLIIIRRNGKDSSHPRELTVEDEEMLVGR